MYIKIDEISSLLSPLLILLDSSRDITTINEYENLKSFLEKQENDF